mgnify:CR=1 FL=1
MTQIFGDFIEELPVKPEHLTIQFFPSSVSLKQRWRNNGLSADFMADYFATFFPGDENSTHKNPKQAEIKSTVSYIANELLENAMKFSDETALAPVTLTLQMQQNKITFTTTNTVPPENVDDFQSFLIALTTSDPNELYLHQLEKNAVDDSMGSGLGLLTMMNDYLAKIGWKFQTTQIQPEVIMVTTMVQLVL